ncbi:hypothetical protein ACGK9R_13250 [Halomonas sp. HNIBRBA4712]|uniref:hypothetical protein n=1 Tax=Halomonas sp. HNIBRBA4712 TaxID=3373087 RepID=UPI00374650B1
MPIARSSYPCVIQALLAAGLILVSLSFLAAGWLLVLLPAALLLIARQCWRQPTGTLVVQQKGEALFARWQHPMSDPGDELPVRCHYLGPWLLGLEIGSRRVWLWPDSLPDEMHRELRRRLHRPGR